MTLLRFSDPGAFDPGRSGGKGSTLAQLAARGFPVPAGFIIPTQVLADFLDGIGLGPDVAALPHGAVEEASLRAVRQRILEASMPHDVHRAIARALDDLERELDRPLAWAVRSSALAEDTREASFAGQYETLLGLRGSDEVARGVLHCWASMFGQRVARYRRARDVHAYRAAVVVQRLIDADVAGVCFSVDPVSGSSAQLVINANYGLGESVVGGQVTPDTFVIERESLTVESRQVGEKAHKVVPQAGGVKTVPVPEALRALPCLSDAQALAVAALALQVEAAQGHPVDIEWAFAGQQLSLLQSRPITTASIAPDWVPETNTLIDPRFPLYSRGNIGEVLPGCITPLSWDHTGKVIERAFRKQLIELGATPEGGPPWQVLGFFYHRPYICVSFLADAVARIPVMTPDTVYEEFVGRPETRTPPFTPGDLLPQRWPAWWRALYTVLKKNLFLHKAVRACTQVLLEQTQTCTPGALVDWSDERLLETVRCTDDLVYPSAIHTWTSTFAAFAFSLLRNLTQAWLDDQDGALAAQLVTGIADLVSAAPAPALYELAGVVKASPALMAYLKSEKSDQEVLEALATDEAARPFREDLAAFLARFGHRAVGEAEFSKPCWREDPAQVMALVRNYVREGTTSPETIRRRQQAAHQAALARLGALNPVKRGLLRAITRRTRQYIAYREHMKDLSILRADRSRRVYAEIGRRLLARGLLRQPDDIFFLLWEEVEALTTGRLSAGEAARISARRRRDYARCQQLSVPKLQRGEPRFITVADHPPGKKLGGMGVSPGQVEGRARVILDPRIEARIEAGEILVAPITDVAWTPLFLQAAGLVVEVGGLLSHGSIVAREYGLPAVVGVAGATQVIETGERLLLDGNAGVVVKLD